MQTLQELKAEQLELEKKLAQNKEKQMVIFDAEFCKKNGFCLGDIVLFEGKKAKIVGFDRCHNGEPNYYKISLFTKGNALGSAQRFVYNLAKMVKA